jgi:DNA-directed RNA polymerase subunit omega
LINPSLDLLLTKVDSRYTLVVATAKRAREIMANEGNQQEDKAMKAVSTALEDINSGRIVCVKVKNGIK